MTAAVANTSDTACCNGDETDPEKSLLCSKRFAAGTLVTKNEGIKEVAESVTKSVEEKTTVF